MIMIDSCGTVHCHPHVCNVALYICMATQKNQCRCTCSRLQRTPLNQINKVFMKLAVCLNHEIKNDLVKGASSLRLSTLKQTLLTKTFFPRIITYMRRPTSWLQSCCAAISGERSIDQHYMTDPGDDHEYQMALVPYHCFTVKLWKHVLVF